MDHQSYENPLITRYSSSEMSKLWSAQTKFSTWRRLWVALAESQQELGLEISDSQLQQLRDSVDQIDFDAAKVYEKKLRHDVMAHVHTYADTCSDAGPIIHLGATSFCQPTSPACLPWFYAFATGTANNRRQALLFVDTGFG